MLKFREKNYDEKMIEKQFSSGYEHVITDGDVIVTTNAKIAKVNVAIKVDNTLHMLLKTEQFNSTGTIRIISKVVLKKCEIVEQPATQNFQPFNRAEAGPYRSRHSDNRRNNYGYQRGNQY